MPLSSSPSFRRQSLLIEFASLKYASPQGIYMSLSPQNPSLWWGVIGENTGPYSSAIFKFTVLFPASYPIHPPIITFISDVFHPLVVPPISRQNNDSNQNNSNHLPPGSFNLGHGFPQWNTPTPISSPILRESPHFFESQRAKRESSSLPSATTPSISKRVQPPGQSTLSVLHYMKSTFTDEKVLDNIPSHDAVNLSAWRAWKDYQSVEEASSSGGKKVWEGNVSACVEASKSEGALFKGLGVGKATGGMVMGSEEMIRFLDTNDEAYEKIKKWIEESVRDCDHLQSGGVISDMPLGTS